MIPHVEPPRFRRWPFGMLDKYLDARKHRKYVEKHGYQVKDWSQATTVEINTSAAVSAAVLDKIRSTNPDLMVSVWGLDWLHPVHAKPLIDELNTREGNKEFIPYVTKTQRIDADILYIEEAK